MNPLVSIIMPLFNAERYVAQSIESVLAQSYTNWELLVCDDCSSDASAAIVASFAAQDPRIKISYSTENKGIAKTRNACLSLAQGRFVAFLDDDDLWTSDKLEKQVRFMLKSQCGFCYANYDLMNEDGSARGKTIRTEGVIDYHKYLKNTIIGCGTVMLDTVQVGEIALPENKTSDDMALWLSILSRGHNAYPLDEVLMHYRVRSDSASSNKLKAARDVWQVYRKIEKIPFFKSLCYFCCYAFNAIKKRIC